LVLVADDEEIARHDRCFDRHQTFYDWQHYIPLIVQKPGALRNGAPFMTMPVALQVLQRHLIKHVGGDRVMAQVLSSIPLHGLDAVLVAVECALESGRPSAEHVMNVLGRLKEPVAQDTIIATPMVLNEEPVANVARYERLRTIIPEANDVA
jgi:hypothetical protein